MFSGSLVAAITPMRHDDTIDFEAWSRLVDFHVAHGTSGVVVGGTTGESATLTEAELVELVTRARERAAGRLQVIAGAGTSSTALTVERAGRLSRLGVDALLVVTPAYNRPTQEGLYRHFEAVAQASIVPLILYNVPSRTAVDLLPPTVARLAALPRIAAIKEAVNSMERIGQLVALAPPGFTILSGDDATARDAVARGARGVISVTANVAPRLVADMIAAALAGDTRRAAELDGRLAGLHEALFVEPNPIPAKWVVSQLLGLAPPGIRLPLTPLEPRHEATLRRAMMAAGLALD
ncbi:MAG TPA: 4-hydroxy-tetrahydrodipicolinate synthase [Steroidobacteraceae bacterium]|jgi:4-hydroxy-tetrahydrodipicolinate synthase|nr:4-hydroxy-tetrahydrodipicolinate synthase [Steroidobacteraceae bacterium]HNS27180.1 4-hydroxy-tetrahydrodipicolinate synthase [Steroidobacteraceae bacterium]